MSSELCEEFDRSMVWGELEPPECQQQDKELIRVIQLTPSVPIRVPTREGPARWENLGEPFTLMDAQCADEDAMKANSKYLGRHCPRREEAENEVYLVQRLAAMRTRQTHIIPAPRMQVLKGKRPRRLGPRRVKRKTRCTNCG